TPVGKASDDREPFAGPPEGWEKKEFDPGHGNTDDKSGWKNVLVWLQKKGPEETPVLNPWIPNSVKALRKTFDAGGAIKSARLYATALGNYEMFLNGKRVGNDFMAPGWTDYRERVL